MSEIKLTPYASALKMGKDKLEALKIPFRVARAQKQAELAKLELEEALAGMQARLSELTSADNLNFTAIIQQQNAIGLKEREIYQYQDILDQMFPCK